MMVVVVLLHCFGIASELWSGVRVFVLFFIVTRTARLMHEAFVCFHFHVFSCVF